MQPEGFFYDPKSATSPTPPNSNLPPYQATSVAAAGIVNQSIRSLTSTNTTSFVAGPNAPQWNYNTQGYGKYPPPPGGFTPAPTAYSVPGYGTPGYQGREIETVSDRHEMGGPAHETHELPSNYRA